MSVGLALSLVAVAALQGGGAALIWWPAALLERAFAGLPMFAAVGSLWKVTRG